MEFTGAGQSRVVIIDNNANITAFDSKSVVDDWPSIADAMTQGVNMGHPVVDAIHHL
jgi:hypothetical protein